ncbi:MAG: hypothetical protein MJ002_07350 [Paludibacteraceae bacterium]|nr:hypothetical protein [Paludibacteraceae bacterium]
METQVKTNRKNGSSQHKARRSLWIDWFSISPQIVVITTYFIGVIMFLVTSLQLVLTIFIPVSKNVSAISVYMRNFSSIVQFAALGFFLLLWCNYVYEMVDKYRRALLFKVVTILTCLFVFVKGIVSLILFFIYFEGNYYVFIYYISDFLACLAVGLFMVVFFVRAFHDNPKHSLTEIKYLLVIPAFLCFLKAATTTLYTWLKFSPNGYPWVFFLAESVAWFFIGIYFIYYSKSRILLKREKESWVNVVRQGVDSEIENACDNTAREYRRPLPRI